MKTVMIREIDNGWLCEWPDMVNDHMERSVAFRSYEEMESWLNEFLLAKAVKAASYTNVSNPLPTQNYKP